MKTILITLMLSTFSMPVWAKDIKITVKGMVCGFCAQGITKKFKALPEVENVDVSLEKKSVVIKTKGSSDISNQTITEILTDSGYNVGDIQK